MWYVVEPRLDREEPHDLAVVLGDESPLKPNRSRTITPPLLVAEVIRQGRDDAVTCLGICLGICLGERTDGHRHRFTHFLAAYGVSRLDLAAPRDSSVPRATPT
jgi:hypothetical protein